MRSYLDALLRYFEFSGRSSRAQYWLYNLVVVVLAIALIGYEYKTTGRIPTKNDISPLMIFLSLFHVIPGITVTVRRLHDVGKSGWWYLLNFVPLGGLWILVWTCYASEPGSNRYGDASGSPSPRNSRRPEPEPYYARALRPSAASNNTSGNIRLDGSSERFI